ncbi:hypothetical protein TNIN_421951 [Trichonephila inaurata madagascariensis]|uniref:Uncharacterized protein n=1 Tax=Trichonephila inaurata madagascariensis TaxID=2747483 RepID=A0A8X7CNB1_9ARAC|nr:hypothetical protein TNIN_421951 [Trichonephila inaurata madagascariensis]
MLETSSTSYLSRVGTTRIVFQSEFRLDGDAPQLTGSGYHVQKLRYGLELCLVEIIYLGGYAQEQRPEKSVTLSRERLGISVRPIGTVACKLGGRFCLLPHVRDTYLLALYTIHRTTIKSTRTLMTTNTYGAITRTCGSQSHTNDDSRSGRPSSIVVGYTQRPLHSMCTFGDILSYMKLVS